MAAHERKAGGAGSFKQAGREERITVLPGGVVTFVHVEIDGSNALSRTLGDRRPTLIETNRDLLHAVWSEHGGVEVGGGFGTDGEAALVAFADAGDAVRAAVKATETVTSHPWPIGGLIRLRIGVHTGIGYPRDGGYIAFPAHQAARVAAVGHGGQVIVSPDAAAAVHSIDTAARPELFLHDLGAYRVRDFDGPIHLFQAERAGTPNSTPPPTPFPPLRTEADVRHNLPFDLPEIHGRTDEALGVAELLTETRVVSVVGPGGVGKTLLCRTVARGLADRHPDGAWFVDLTAHCDRSTMRGAIADVFSVTPDRLDEHIASRELLLVLDNTEQATTIAGSLVSELTAVAPNLSVLVSSREPLSIGAERVWRLNPLTDEAATTGLFAERARTVDPHFDLDGVRDDVAELCRRLDGLPLAIELAAARVGEQSVRELIASLDDGLRELQSRRRDLDARQRTATGMIDWSYRLLEEDEQLVLRRLSVFQSGIGLDAATAAVADSGLDRIDVEEIVWSLVAKSLAHPVTGDGTTRFRLLETVRTFTRRMLVEADELDVTNRQVGNWYRTRFDPTAAFTRPLVAALADELATMRAVTVDLAESDPDLGQWLVWSMTLANKSTAPGRTADELGPIVDKLSVPGEAAVGMLAAVALNATVTRNLDRAEELLDRARALTDTVDGRPLGQGSLDNTEAIRAVVVGDLAGAVAVARAALPKARTIERVSLVNTIGIAEAERGDFEAASEAFEQTLALARATGAVDAEVAATMAVAELAHRTGDLERAATHTLAGLKLSGEIGLRLQSAFTIVGAARLLADGGRHGDAVELHAAADRVMDETGQNMLDTDQALSVRMMERALTVLGRERFEQRRAAGAAMAELEAFVRAVDGLERLARADVL